jgi:hypothetical protein
VDSKGKIGPATQTTSTTSVDKMYGGGTPIPGTFSGSGTSDPVTVNSNADPDLASMAKDVSNYKTNADVNPNVDSPLQEIANGNNETAHYIGAGAAVGTALDVGLTGGAVSEAGGLPLALGLVGLAFYDSNPEHISINKNIK